MSGSWLQFLLPTELVALLGRMSWWCDSGDESSVEMFLDIIDLSKTVDKHGTECCHVFVPFLQIFDSRSFWTAARSYWTRSRSYKIWLKMVKTGLDRQERVVQACQNIRILRHSLSQPVFSMFSHRFSSVFGMFTIVQESVEAVQGRFFTFPIKICLLIASLRSDWSNTTERFLYSTVFAAASGNTTVAASFPMHSRIALLCNTWAIHGRLERRLDLRWEEGEV